MAHKHERPAWDRADRQATSEEQNKSATTNPNRLDTQAPTAMAAAYARALERLKPPPPEMRDFESEWALRPVDGGAP